MRKNRTSARAGLLGSVCVAAMAIGAQGVSAQSAVIVDENADGNHAISIAQDNNAFDVSTTISSIIDGVTEIDIDGIVTDSTLVIGGSGAAREIYSATLAGNEATATLTSDDNNALNGSGPAEGLATGSANVEVENANLAIAVSQDMAGVTAVAEQTTRIGISTDDVVTSSVAVLNNVQESIGVMNRATTTLSSEANLLDASAAVVVAQNVAPDIGDPSSLIVRTDAVAEIVVDALVTADIDASRLTLAGNTQRAIGVGNVGTNTLEVSANEITAPGDGTHSSASVLLGDAAATAANVLVSQQQIFDTFMLAEVAPSGPAFRVSVNDAVGLSEVSNDSNTAVANIRGNVVGNTLAIDGNNVQTVDASDPLNTFQAGGTLASLASGQVIDSNQQIIARVLNGALTDIGGELVDSTVSTSSNRIEATATGNSGSNDVTVSANNLDTSGVGSTGSMSMAGIASSTAAINLASSQYAAGGGEILATLSTLDIDGNPVSGAMVTTSIAGDISDSTVVSDGNILAASATGNQITADTNAITVSGNDVATTTGLSNAQISAQQITAVVGAPGTDFVAGTPDDPFVVGGTVAGGVWTGSVAGLTTDQLAAFQAQYSGELGYNYDPVTEEISFASVGDGFLEIPSMVAGTADILATPQSGGVVASLGGTLDRSTVSVGENMTSGSVTGNTATNRTTVIAVNLNPGAEATTSSAMGSDAIADHSLSNNQDVQSSLTTSVAATFGIDADLDSYSTNDSALSVSDNQQYATTQGNVGINALSLTATNMETGGAVASTQNGFGSALSSTSDMDVFAPAAMTGSTLSLDGNRNESVATVNTVNNALTVDSANLDSISGGVNALTMAFDLGLSQAVADFALSNTQSASGATEATASSTIANQDGAIFGAGETVGITASTASLSGNVTLAEGSVNRAANSMTLGGGAEFSGTGALLNMQTATSTVDASSDAAVTLDLTGGGDSVVTDSALTVAGNAAAATARGNVGTSTLSVAALDLNAAGDAVEGMVDAFGATHVSSLMASHTVLSHQQSAGAISAVSDLMSAVTLEGGDLDGNTIDASTLSVTGNRSLADAAANVGTNRLNLTAGVDISATGAVGNSQINDGAISAVASSQSAIALNTASTDSALSADNSTMTVSGNQTVAQARANVSTNVLNASGLVFGDTTGPTSTSANGTGGLTALVEGLNMAVLNGQTNTAGVTAQVTSAVYQASASNAGYGALNASSTMVTGNIVQASAAGNTSYNLVDLAALNHSGGSAGIASAQSNGGDIAALVTSAQTGSVYSGAVSGSSVQVGGNSISASAIGNSVTSTLNRN